MTTISEKNQKKKEEEGPSQILSYLYIGNKNHAKSLKILAQYEIKYIINCTPKRSDDRENGCSNYFEKQKEIGLTYQRIPILDNRGENIIPYIEIVYRFIEESRHYGNILVHCHKGISRSVSMVIGYLMKKNELTYDEALTHIQMFRPIAQPNESFEQQLRSYQSTTITNTTSSTSSSSVNVYPSGPSMEKVSAIGPVMNPSSTAEITTTEGDEELHTRKKPRIDS